MIDQAAPRQRVLVVSHNTTGVAPYGGVEVYQESVRLALAGQFEFWFYTPDRSAKPLGKATACVMRTSRLLRPSPSRTGSILTC